jgi:hypothetical protein
MVSAASVDSDVPRQHVGLGLARALLGVLIAIVAWWPIYVASMDRDRRACGVDAMEPASASGLLSRCAAWHPHRR